jgi:hypothetical protein
MNKLHQMTTRNGRSNPDWLTTLNSRLMYVLFPHSILQRNIMTLGVWEQGTEKIIWIQEGGTWSHIQNSYYSNSMRFFASGVAQWCSTGLRAGWSGVRVPAGAGNFSIHHRVQTDSGPYPASCPMGTRGSFLGVKRPGREADHSPPSSAEVKECMELYLHSPIRLHGVVLSYKKSTGTTLPFTFYT